MRPPGESPRATRQKVPPRKGRTLQRTVSLLGNTGLGAACRSNSYVASGDATHQHNGAYSRADAPTSFTGDASAGWRGGADGTWDYRTTSSIAAASGKLRARHLLRHPAEVQVHQFPGRVEVARILVSLRM